MSPRVVIQEARDPRDLAAVQDLFREYVYWLGRTYALDVGYQDFAGEMATFPLRYESLLLARVDDAAAGACGLKRLDATRCELKRLYVRPAFRGLDLGATLTTRLMADAHARGFATMALDTHGALTSAIKLYERLGFTPSAPHNEPGNACTLFFARPLP